MITEIKMMTNSKTIEITAALFFFKRRHESWIKFKEGAVICSRSSSVFFVMEEIHPQGYLQLFHNALVSFPFILGSLLKHEFLDQLDRTIDPRSK